VADALKSVDPNVVLRRARLRVDAAAADAFEPVANVDFTHLSSAVESTIPAALVLGLTTATSSGALIAATIALGDRMNILQNLINQVTYVLSTNGLSS
jgi:hypothetical protein